ncbi:MAG: DHA2 family efflux MFS transporter permease subunit [Thermoleophilia bacterium]|nr:DHA2 family efflux MFS transporter permease subunit [Thermoleophilia bacterium]
MNTASNTEVHRWRAFAVLAVSFFMTIVDLTIVNVALPTIGRKLHFSESNLQWVVTAYGLTFGGFLLLGGRAADLLGRRRIMMAGLTLFTAASLGAGLATSDGFLIAMRGLQGLGAAVVLPAALSIVMNMFTEGAERNKALGIWGGIGAAGATVGLITGGLLTRYVGWQFIFFLNVPIGALALLLARRIVPESRLVGVRRRFDLLGAVAVTGALLLLVYAISNAPQVGWAAARTVALLAGSVVLLIAFLVVETRVESPLMPLRIFRLRSVAVANAVGLLLGGSFFGFIFVGTLYMQQVLGYSALQAGVAWLAASLTSVALAGLSQMLVTRVSPGPVMGFGMALIAGGVLWATQVPVHGHFWRSLAGPFFIAGAGTAFSFIPISIAGLAGVGEPEAGLASGLLNTSQQLGGAIGVAIASTVAATHLKTLTAGGDATNVALTGGFQWAFWVCGAIGLLALPATAGLLRRRWSTPIEDVVPAIEELAA